MKTFLWKNSLELFQHSANRSFPIFIPSAAKKRTSCRLRNMALEEERVLQNFSDLLLLEKLTNNIWPKKEKKKIKCMDKWNDIWIWNARTSVLKLIRCQNADGKTFQEKREVVQIGLVIHELSACPEQVDSVALWGSTGVKTLTHHPFMLFINRMVPIWMLPILSCERNHKRYTCLLQIHHLTRPKINNKLA